MSLEPVEPFGNHLPVEVRFGAGSVAALAETLRGDGARRPFVVLDEALRTQPAVERALAGLGAGATIHPKGRGEPTVAEVELAADALSASRADAVVAIGGGSAIDTAKAARLVAGQGGPYARFAAGAPIEQPRLPLVAVPTTAGTGSEVSGGAVISDPSASRKAGIASPSLRAQHALVDPELTYDLPPEPTLHGGVDALAQAIAAIAVRVRTPVGTGIALEAIRLTARALPAVVRDGADRAARSQMACASLLAGLAMNASDCGAEHSLAQAIGGRAPVPHGLTVGLVLAETMEHDRSAVPDLFERVADALGEPDDGSRDGSRAVRAVRRLLSELGFPTLRSVGVSEDDLEALAEAALADPFVRVAPAAWTRADAVAAYRAALALESR